MSGILLLTLFNKIKFFIINNIEFIDLYLDIKVSRISIILNIIFN